MFEFLIRMILCSFLVTTGLKSINFNLVFRIKILPQTNKLNKMSHKSIIKIMIILFLKIKTVVIELLK